MIARSCRSPLLLFVFLCAFLYWHFNKAPESLEHNISTTHPQVQPSGTEPVHKKPRIAIVTFITDPKSYLHLSLKNKDHYARRHGYDFIVDYESHTEKGTCYWKFNMMERLIKQGKWDWIWWVDFDTLITNTEIKVADVIEEAMANATNPDAIDWIITHDCNGLNMGSFVLRGHERSLSFIDELWEYSTHKKEDGHDPSEQDAMVELLKQEKAAARTHRVPQWKLNSFPQEIACFDESRQVWEPGQLILHFAGAWAHVQGEDPTGQLMQKYEDDIMWGDWKQFY
ncbi:hypothetical protein EJ04DRAFT_505494 [Polyplosphaeria fusca]|uniref:Glycosyltransferase family 34 protein n=1 Tax=Polyplosphaeria fusca TaxID=682080 RepID=A0A9P4QMC4_9PLEO|nr:hypothetical protein EJ04DRAFT_505494 [Polyplosphaeria fusca]